MMESINSQELTEEKKREEEPPVVEPQYDRYIMSKEGDEFLQIPKYNDGNIELGQYIQSGGFASVYSINKKPNLVCRITHIKMSEESLYDELEGLKIQSSLDLPNIVKIHEYGYYKVKDDIVAKKYCRERPRQDWCFLDENADQEKQQKEKNKIDVREKHFLKTGNKGIYAVMERIPSDLFEYLFYKEDFTNLHLEQSINVMYSIFIQLILTVKFIHENNYVHRDIKTENIGIVFDEEKNILIKLFDFGYAVNTAEDMRQMEALGTRGYFDKNLYKYQRNEDGENVLITPSREDLEFSDVYACGITMFHIALVLVVGQKRIDERSMHIYIDDFKNSNYSGKKKLLEKLKFKKVNESKPLSSKAKLFNKMLEAIKYCVVELKKTTIKNILSLFRSTSTIRKTPEKILEFLEQSTTGGKKKTKKKKTNKIKTNKIKSKKKKTNKKKTKKKKSNKKKTNKTKRI